MANNNLLVILIIILAVFVVFWFCSRSSVVVKRIEGLDTENDLGSHDPGDLCPPWHQKCKVYDKVGLNVPPVGKIRVNFNRKVPCHPKHRSKRCREAAFKFGLLPEEDYISSKFHIVCDGVSSHGCIGCNCYKDGHCTHSSRSFNKCPVGRH